LDGKIHTCVVFTYQRKYYNTLTGGTVKDGSDLVGILFQPPSEAESGIFWDDEYELQEAEDIVLDKHKPVCIHKDGISVLDDVGGLSGFADFLGIIYEGEDKEEASSTRAWARSLGWSARKVSSKMML